MFPGLEATFRITLLLMDWLGWRRSKERLTTHSCTQPIPWRTSTGNGVKQVGTTLHVNDLKRLKLWSGPLAAPIAISELTATLLSPPSTETHLGRISRSRSSLLNPDSMVGRSTKTFWASLTRQAWFNGLLTSFRIRFLSALLLLLFTECV